jgi:phosphoribosylanthranilate isomerase
MDRIRLTVSGIASIEEARLAVAAGADAVALASDAPRLVAPGEMALARIAAAVPPPVAVILPVAAWTAGAVAAQADLSGASAVQVEHPLDPEEYPGMRRILRGRRFIQRLPAEEPEGAALRYGRLADALLLDAGTAAGHDWAAARRIAAAMPLFLDGFADITAIAAAISALRPWGVDAGATLRRAGRLDRERLATVAGMLRAAGGEPAP